MSVLLVSVSLEDKVSSLPDFCLHLHRTAATHETLMIIGNHTTKHTHTYLYNYIYNILIFKKLLKYQQNKTYLNNTTNLTKN